MTLLEKIKEGKTLLADGAWGTEFAKKGFTAGTDCPELLNVDNQALVLEVAQSYVDAGSDIILANTFGGNEHTLNKYNIGDRLEELNAAGVRLSKKAAGNKVFVLGSIGPSGAFLYPLGTVNEETMTEWFARQVRAFVEGGADGILIETMTDMGEICCALRAAKENSTLPVVCSMTFDKGVSQYATMMGIRPGNAAKVLTDQGADIVGANCGAGIDNIIEIAGIMRAATNLPLWCKPNAGMPELIGGKTVYNQTPEIMASCIAELVEAGANIVGGCCGTTPDHIRAFRKVLDGMK